MLSSWGAGEDFWESLGQQGDQISQSSRKLTLNIHWKDWCWSWNSNTFGYLMWRVNSLEKILMLGKIEGKRRRGWQRMRWLDTISQSLLKVMSIELVKLSNHLNFSHPLFLLPSIFPSLRVFSNESALHIRRLKYWSFSFTISPSYENSGLISFRIDWFDLLAVQSLLQHHSLKAWILGH